MGLQLQQLVHPAACSKKTVSCWQELLAGVQHAVPKQEGGWRHLHAAGVCNECMCAARSRALCTQAAVGSWQAAPEHGPFKLAAIIIHAAACRRSLEAVNSSCAFKQWCCSLARIAPVWGRGKRQARLQACSGAGCKGLQAGAASANHTRECGLTADNKQGKKL